MDRLLWQLSVLSFLANIGLGMVSATMLAVADWGGSLRLRSCHAKITLLAQLFGTHYASSTTLSLQPATSALISHADCSAPTLTINALSIMLEY